MTGQYKVMAELLPHAENCYVVQRYKGIEIFRAVSNFSIKNGEVVGVQNE
jgi:hypothetical protein